MDQNVCDSCFSVLWRLCWSCCSCLYGPSLWFTNVGRVSSLYFHLFPVFLGFVMPVRILSPAPAVNRRDTVSKDSTTELKLSAPDTKVKVTGIICPLCRLTDAAERKSNALVTQTFDAAVCTGLQTGRILYSSLCWPRESRDRVGPPLLMVAEMMLHLCYLTGMAAGAVHIQDCAAVFPFSRR